MSFSKSSRQGSLLVCLFVLSFVIGSVTEADVPDMMINSDGTSQIHNMSQIWVSPIDSNVVMTVWRDFRLGYRRVAIGVSYDEGQTWIDSLLAREGSFRHSDPIIVGDRLGNFHTMVMARNVDLGLSDFNLWKTTDNGANWSDPFYLLNDADTSYLEDKEFLAIDRTGGAYDGNMYVAWTRFPNPTRIIFMRSTTGGATWGDTLVVGSPDTSGADAGSFAFPIVDADGCVYVVWAGWLKIGEDWYRRQKIVKSTDGGQSFTQPEVILENNWIYQAPGHITVQNSVCMDADITNGPYRGNIYLVGPDGVEDGPYYHSDILFMKSSDGGAGWTAPIRVNDDPSGTPVWQFHPWITVNQKGAITVFFYDQRNDPPLYEKFDTYVAFSFDGGETFTANHRVSDISSDPDDALTGRMGDVPFDLTDKPFSATPEPVSSTGMILCNYIGVAAYIDQVHCTWTDTRDGNQNVYYSNFGIPLLRPRLLLPESGSYQTAYPTFKWGACGYFAEVTYDLEISTDSTFTSIDFVYTDVDTNVFTVSAPLDEVQYFWRVKAFRTADAGESEYSEVWSLKVDASAPDVPILLFPADGSNVIPYTPKFSWSEETKGSPVFYTLQVADDSLFPAGPEFYEHTNIYDTSFTLLDTLIDSTVYYWRVKALDEAGQQSDWQVHPFQFYSLIFVRGDANGDGIVNVADLVYLVNYLYRAGDPPAPEEAGDANCDGIVNVADLVYLVNYLYRGGDPPGCP
jgi:hypothetical protein